MPRNVALLCLDTVRKDFFDKYAPRVQELADVSFEQCRAASSWSVPSHASMFTGKLPHIHGVHTYNPDFSELSPSDTFLGSLTDYNTVSVSANIWATSTFGFTNLFDFHSDVSPRRRFSDGADLKRFDMQTEATGIQKYKEFLEYSLRHDSPVQSVANGLFSKIRGPLIDLQLPTPIDDGANIIIRESKSHLTDSEKPFFLFANFMDAHGPMHNVFGYDSDLFSTHSGWKPTDFDPIELNLNGISEDDFQDIETYRGLYTASIDYLDRKVSKFVKYLESVNDLETTIIVTADHGENLGYPEDDHLFNHMGSLSESLLHVPLVIINPPSGYDSTEGRFFSHVQLGDLITGLAQNRSPEVFRDRIAAELVGGNLALQNGAHNSGNLEYWDRMQRCVYEGDHKYLWDSLGNSLTYSVQTPCKQELVAEDAEVPEWANAMFQSDIETSKKQAMRSSGMREVSESTEQRLENLGYK